MDEVKQQNTFTNGKNRSIAKITAAHN